MGVGLGGTGVAVGAAAFVGGTVAVGDSVAVAVGSGEGEGVSATAVGVAVESTGCVAAGDAVPAAVVAAGVAEGSASADELPLQATTRVIAMVTSAVAANAFIHGSLAGSKRKVTTVVYRGFLCGAAGILRGMTVPPNTAMPVTRGMNFADADRNLSFALKQHARAADYERAVPLLHEVGEVAGGVLDALAAVADANEPTLRQYDERGDRIDAITYHPSFVAMQRLGFADVVNMVFNPAAGMVAGRLGESELIYYCVDEYTAFTGVSDGLKTIEDDLFRGKQPDLNP